MRMKKSPLAPATFPKLPEVNGVRISAISAGVKYKNRDDVMLASLSPGTTIAGVLTNSLTASAPVDWCRKNLAHAKARAIIVNSGNANAFTGKVGHQHVKAMVHPVSKALGCPQNQVFVASTGVIGEKLPADRISRVVPKLVSSQKPDSWDAVARAIMTTDTFPKGASASAQINGHLVTIVGIAKGSGMIAPDMATMLSFVFTDAAIPAALLQKQLKRAADKSFNCITVDGDTSTSDTLLLAATGQAKNPAVTALKDLNSFQRALQKVLTDLATQVVKDGEGASKFITIDVSGAASAKAARRIGLSIANSPLVKTAIAGEDANWGRVVMAVGKAGEKADRDKLSIAMGGIVICKDGQQNPNYRDSDVARHLKGSDIHVAVDVGIGKGKARVWTCDLTHGYISINADYRS